MSQGHYNFFRCLVLLLFSSNSYALEWRDMWQTPDQQAEKAFQRKQYEQAAEQFTQLQWKAAAQYESGHYQEVLETLKDNQSSGAFYNKGNAYARLGQFKEALAAYDKTLQLDPENTDAIHNKELIEKELEKQQQQQKQQQGDSDSDQQKQDKDNSQEQEQEQQDQEGKQEEDQDGQGEQSDRQNESNEENTDDNQNAEQGRQQNDEEQEDEQAQVDEQAAVEKQDNDKTSENYQTTEESSREEGQQANEQWLKRIPDDPAGLLRRKFKYQYKQKQREPNRQAEQW